MSALFSKLRRDLWALKGQSAAVGLLVALAVGTFAGAVSTHRALVRSRDAYYEANKMPDVFAQATRTPQQVASRLEEIPGVIAVETRSATLGIVSVPGFEDPASGRFVSLPAPSEKTLGQIYIRAGRRPLPGAEEEVVINEAFAEAHGLRPGDRFEALVHGKRMDLQIVGIGLSPEHVYSVRPGTMLPDDAHFGIVWMDFERLSAALGMDGAFNEAVFLLGPGADEDEVTDSIDDVLDPFGGMGAYGHDQHQSARFLSEELEQLETTAYFVPSIFLGVAAFLLNIIFGRMVATQREQIATIKAVGYGNLAIGRHYAQMTMLIAAAGIACGAGVAYVFGSGMTDAYGAYYRFPKIDYALGLEEVLGAGLLSVLAGLVGTFGAVRKAVSLRPAEAMKPAAPATYEKTFVERIGLDVLFGVTGRMVLRNLRRQPFRAGASVLGVAFAVALLVVGLFFSDAIEHIIDLQFRKAQRQDLTVTFTRAVGAQAVHEMARLPGVLEVEPLRELPARLRHEHCSYRAAITGMVPGASMRRILSTSGDVITVPERGIMVSDTLARNLCADLGDAITVELLEESRRTEEVMITAIADEPFGTSAYMSLDATNDMLRVGPRINAALVRFDAAQSGELLQTLRDLPVVAGISLRRAMLGSFERMSREALLFFSGVLSFFAAAIAVGVIYNAARVSLSERQRELATMRVVGMTRVEISQVLLGELGAIAALGLPLGAVLGYGLALATARSAATEMYRIPVVVEPSTYVFAMGIVAAVGLAVALRVRKRLDRLDLIGALKTRE